MAIGSAFGALAEGLAGGLQTGVQLGQRQEQLELQRQEAKVRAIGVVNNMSKWSPEMRKQFGAPFLKQLGKQYGMEFGETALKAFTDGNQALVQKITNYWAGRLKDGAAFAEVAKEMNDPEKIAAFGAQSETADIRKETLAETKRYHSGSLGLQAAQLAETRAERAERRRERETATVESAAKDVRDTYAGKANPSDAGNFFSALADDPGWKRAVAARDTNAMRSAADSLAAKNPKWFREDAELPPISKLYRALDKARTPEERASIQGQIAEEQGRADKAIAEGKRATGDLKLLERASIELDKFNDRIMPKNDKGEPTINRGLVNALGLNLPFSEGRQVRAAIRRSLLDYVFARSGKQVAVGEIDRWMEVYMPSPLDNDATVKDKMRNLRQNLDTLAGTPTSPAPSAPSTLPRSNTNSWKKSGSGIEYQVR